MRSCGFCPGGVPAVRAVSCALCLRLRFGWEALFTFYSGWRTRHFPFCPLKSRHLPHHHPTPTSRRFLLRIHFLSRVLANLHFLPPHRTLFTLPPAAANCLLLLLLRHSFLLCCSPFVSCLLYASQSLSSHLSITNSSITTASQSQSLSYRSIWLDSFLSSRKAIPARYSDPLLSTVFLLSPETIHPPVSALPVQKHRNIGPPLLRTPIKVCGFLNSNPSTTY